MAIILCVEDEPDIRHDIVEELQDAGFATIEAANGEEGLLEIRKQKPDLVLCDIIMPVMSGLELLVAVKENQPGLSEIPFIMLSALANTEDIVKGKVSVRSGRGMGPVKRISHVEARPHKVLSFCW